MHVMTCHFCCPLHEHPFSQYHFTGLPMLASASGSQREESMAIFRRGESRTEFANLYTRSFQEPFSPYMKLFWEESTP